METGDLVAGFAALIFVLFIYLIPWIVAASREHPHKASIAIVNIFFGWTLLGWVACLAWAVGNKMPERDPISVEEFQKQSGIYKLEKS